MGVCPECKKEMLWGGDHSYEDYGIEEKDGIVSNLSCKNEQCEVDTVVVYKDFESRWIPL